MSKGKRKLSETGHQGFPDASDDDSSSGPSTSASTREKGKGRAGIDEDEDEGVKVNTMWQTDDGQRQWLVRLNVSASLRAATEAAFKRLRIPLDDDEALRIVHVRQEGQEVPILDEYDFDSLKKRALASQDPLFPVIIRIYSSEIRPRHAFVATSRSISPGKPKTPLSRLRKPKRHSLVETPQEFTDRQSLKNFHRNQERRSKKLKAAANAEDTPSEAHFATGVAASTSKRSRPSSPTSTSGSKSRRRKKPRKVTAAVEPILPSPESNIHPALRAPPEGVGQGLSHRPIKPSPLAEASRRTPPRDPSPEDSQSEVGDNLPERTLESGEEEEGAVEGQYVDAEDPQAEASATDAMDPAPESPMGDSARPHIQASPAPSLSEPAPHAPAAATSQADVPAQGATASREHILSPVQLPPSKKRHIKPPDGPPSVTSKPILEPQPVLNSSPEVDSQPATSPSVNTSMETPVRMIQLTKPGWNLFRKPASPIFTAEYSSSSIDVPPEGSAQYRKKTRKSRSGKAAESSAEPSASIPPSAPAGPSSFSQQSVVSLAPDPVIVPVEEASAVAPVPAVAMTDDLAIPDAIKAGTTNPASMRKKKPSLSAQIMAKHRAKLDQPSLDPLVVQTVDTPKPSMTATISTAKLSAQIMAKHRAKLDAESLHPRGAETVEGNPTSPVTNKVADSTANEPAAQPTAGPSTKTESSTESSRKKKGGSVEAARTNALRSPSADGLEITEDNVQDIHPSLRMPDIDLPNDELRIEQASPSSRDADSVENVVGDKTPITAEPLPFETFSESPSTSTYVPDLPPQAKEKRRAHRKGRRLEGIDLDIEDKELDGLSASAQRAKLAGRGSCLICGKSPIHLQKDCSKVKGGEQVLQALLLQRQAEAESERAANPLKKGQPSEEILASIEAIEGWIRRLTTVRNRVMGLEVNVAKTPSTALTMAEELDLLSAQSAKGASEERAASRFRSPAKSHPSAPHPSHLPPLLQKALAKPSKAGSTSGVSASDALIETGDSGSESDSEGSAHASENDSDDESNDHSDEEERSESDASNSDESVEDNVSASYDDPSDNDLDLEVFMKRPPTKDQMKRARLSAASMQPVQPPSVASGAESVEESDEEVQANDSGSSIGDFEGVESHKDESDGSRSLIETHTPPRIAASPHQDGDRETTAVAVTAADRSSKSNHSFVALNNRGSSSPVVDTFAGARALREAIDEERTPMFSTIGLPSPPASANDLVPTQLANAPTTNSQTKTSRQPSSLAPAAEISPGKQAVAQTQKSRSSSSRQRSTSRSSAIVQAHRDARLLPNGRSRLNTTSSPETRLRQLPVESSPETGSRKRSSSREVVVELPSRTKATRMSLAPVSEHENHDSATQSPRMATRATPGTSKANGVAPDRPTTPERSAPPSSASSANLHLDFNSGLGVKTPVQPSPIRTRKTRSSQVDELQSSQPIVPSSSTVKRETISQRTKPNGRPNGASQASGSSRGRPNGTSQASVTSSKGQSSLANGVSDSFPDSHGSHLRRGNSQRARSIPEETEESPVEVESEAGDHSASASDSDDNTTIPSRPPIRPPVPLRRRAESQQIINPIPSLFQLPTEMLRNGSMRSHLRSSGASLPTPSMKRLDASSGSESGESDATSSEEENVPLEKRGRIANGRKPKQKKSGAPIGGW